MSERLKERPVCAAEPNKDIKREMDEKMRMKRADAYRTLDVYIKGLVEIMRAVDRDKVMTMHELEEYILDRLSAHEEMYFKMTDEDFEEYLKFERFQRAMRGK